ncbi:dynactin subunit 1-like isoform X2 [Planococcus citri]|uniref:dynactin subunit 1-like isoform X2 n=1 Tax=Planococcus citri TaxID=170843 RepID=UPI0031F7CB83
MASLQVGSRVEVTGKDSQGVVAYIGTTLFAPGKWVGVILDEPKGKNNGTVQGKNYFECEDNRGIFVRVSHLSLIDESGNKIDLSKSKALDESSRSGSGLKSRYSSSQLSFTGRSVTTPASSRSREDVRASNTAPPVPGESLLKRASFVESTQTKGVPKSRLSLSTPVLKSKSRIPTTITKSLTGDDKDEPANNEQTGFVETLKPQFTPGQVITSPVVQTQRTPQAAFIDPVEHEGLKAQIQDLSEKLETLRIKHKEKLYENDSLKLKLDQAAEFKIKIMESQAALKKELEQIKKEKEEAVQAHEDLSDIADALEMATLDKEMAEEKAEALQLELAEAKEKIEELTLDFEILKAEFDKIGTSSGESDENGTGTSSYQMKQLEQQNLRLRDTLVRMRDLSAHEKHETQKLQKDLEEKKNENTELRKVSDKYQAKIAELENTIAELHEQVDAALGAEEMVEQLGLQKLGLEDKIKELQEAVADLEELQDINDQLQEDSRELELQLREEVDLANVATREALREKENALEALADRELTIVKFRELVQKLQDQCQELQAQLQKESIYHDSMKMSMPDMLDFKKMFAETKAQARAIDLELRRMEVQQSQQHIQYLIAYMPDSFMTRGGDNDALLMLVLITRLMWKSEILLSQLRDKFPSVELSNKGELVKGHTAEQFASRCRISYHLHLLQAVLRQFTYGLNTCTPETLMKAGSSYPEMSQQEKILDGYIELLKTDQLDENVRSENLEKCVNYFNTMHTLLLLSSGDTTLHQTKLLLDHTVAFSTACDSIRTDVAIVQALIQNNDTSDMSPLCQHLSTVAEVMQQHLKQIRRRISAVPDVANLPVAELATNLLKTSICASKLTRALRDIAKTAFSQIALNTDEIYLSPEKLLEIANASCDKVWDESSTGQSAIGCLKNSMNYFANEIANIAQAMQDVESQLVSDTTAASKNDKATPPPILLRAAQVKNELEQAKALKQKLDSKDNDIKELKMALRNKQEEIGELTIRKDIAEKKLTNSDSKFSNTVRDYEMNIQKLQRKLEEANQLMKRKETEFEETMDHLQADIDSLESEKGELKDKLKNYSKKVLIEGIAKNAAASGVTGHLSMGLGSPTSAPGFGTSDPFLVNEIKGLRGALAREKERRSQLETEYYTKMLRKLEPIPVFKKDSEIDKEILDLENDSRQLMKDITNFVSLPKVVDLTKRVPGTLPTSLKDDPATFLLEEVQRTKSIQHRVVKLQERYHELVMKKNPNATIRTDFATFPAPGGKQMLSSSDQSELIGKLILPCSREAKLPRKPCEVTLNIQQLNSLVKEVAALCH